MENARRRARDAARDFLVTAAEDLAARSALDAPIETGTLRASVSPGPGEGESAITEQEFGDRTLLTAEVSFSTPYAARQHEEVTWKHPEGGKAKYLESNLLAMAPRYEEALRATVEKAMRG